MRVSPLYPLAWGAPEDAAGLAARLGDGDWQALHRAATQHRLRPLLHRRAQAGHWPIPANLAADWRAASRQAALIALRQRAELVRIGKVLGRAGLRAAVLKGGAFVWNGWIDPALRPMRDLDLLVAPDAVDRAVAVLQAAGWREAQGGTMAEGKHRPALVGRAGVWIEPHLHLFDTFAPAEAAREAAYATRALARAAPAVVPGLVALTPTDTLLHLILHAVNDHQFNNGPLLLTDLQVLTGSGQIDWEQFWSEARTLRVERACQLALGLGEALAGIAVAGHGHPPAPLPPRLIERAAALMLVDMEQRSALGWPGQLLRTPAHRWLPQALRMLQRRGARGSPAVKGGWSAALAHMAGQHGRARIADAVMVSLWLKRG